MKKIVICLSLLLSFLSFTKSVNAAGQVCCPDKGFYDPESGQCTWTVPTYGRQYGPTACWLGEVCVGTDKGVCSANEEDGDECCPGSTVFYDPTRESCAEIVSQHPYEVEFSETACEPDQWCTLSGVCVSGEKEKEQPTTPITLLQPQFCCLVDLDPNACPLESSGIQTALGCFPTEPTAIIQWILKYAIMLAGGIGFLIMLFASFQIMTSSGDPEKLKAGQELLGSAIMGMLLIVFSLFILRFIGVTILKIPGWG